MACFYEIFNLSSSSFVDFFVFEPEPGLSLGKNLFEFSQIFARIYAFNDFALDLTHALFDCTEKLVNSVFELLADLVGGDGLHLVKRVSVGFKLLIKEVF